MSRQPPPTTTKQQQAPLKAATADRIRAAADELFCQRGYGAVSVGDIAAQAGVNKALVFYHFESKAQLFERVLERYPDSEMIYERNIETLRRLGLPRLLNATRTHE